MYSGSVLGITDLPILVPLSAIKWGLVACVALGSRGHKKKRAREKETREGVSPSRAPVFSFAHYFQASAAQARGLDPSSVLIHRLFWLILMWEFRSVYERVNLI